MAGRMVWTSEEQDWFKYELGSDLSWEELFRSLERHQYHCSNSGLGAPVEFGEEGDAPQTGLN